MYNAARLALAIAAIALVLSAPPAGADHELRVNVVRATAEQRAMIDQVVGRYEAIGLRLPSVTIAVHDDQSACGDYLGYYDHRSRHLDLCNWGQHATISPASTLLHELAHAWSLEHMNEAARRELVDLRQLEVWNGANAWWHNGQEQAAEIIAWAVGGDLYESPYLDSVDEAARVEAARLLLGAAYP